MGGIHRQRTPGFPRDTWHKIGAALLGAMLGLSAAACGGPSTASKLTGTWVGTYLCRQGKTGLRLTVNASTDGTLAAIFSFYAVPDNPGVSSGKFTMTGRYTATGETFTMGHWVSQPPGYLMVSLNASPPADSGTVLNGKVSTAGCSTFTVKKT